MASHIVKPGDKIQKVLDKAAPGDTVVFQQGTYEDLMLNINVKELTLHSDNAEVTGNSTLQLNRPGVTVEGFCFVGNGVVNAKVNDVDDEATMAKNAVIRNNTFKNYEGYAKRILVASSSLHSAINMNALIENNTFQNIKGLNNRKKPGGELISVKAGGAKICNNTFDDVAGMISLRGGEHSLVECNTMTNTVPKISGIQVYGSNNKVIDNTLDDNAVILLGAGESDAATGKQPKGDHLAANNAVVKGNKAGMLIQSYNYKNKGKKRKNGEFRVYNFKAKNVDLEDNDFIKIKDMAGNGVSDKKDDKGKKPTDGQEHPINVIDDPDHTVKPGDHIQKVLDKAAAGDSVLFQKGTYKELTLNVNKKNLTLCGNEAEMVDCSILLNRSGVTVEGFTFVGKSTVNAKVNNVNDEATMGKNAVIRNNTFKDYSGYAKRILVASSSLHESINMNALIENNTFQNIKGLNNRGKAGGELISAKAGGVKICNNTFSDVAGRISLRGGAHSVVDSNVMTDTAPKISGISVFGPYNQILNNQLDDDATNLLGAGESDAEPGKQPFGDHLPASHALVEGNHGGTIILSSNYKSKGKKRTKKTDIAAYGEQRVYNFQAVDVHLLNNDAKVVNQAE